MKFRLWALRYSMRSLRPLHVPEGGETNLLRGRFGAALLRTDPQAYRCLFKPHRETGPSGLADPPRPFAFRDPRIEGSDISFAFHLFDMRQPWELGPVFETMLGAETLSAEEKTIELPLEPNGSASGVTVRFVTPTELKSAGDVVGEPQFSVLATRARDRVSVLSALYGDGPLDLDYRGFGERAALVTMTRCELRHVDAQRRSRATGQTHSLGGFVGEASYAGNLGEFLPLLRAAQWTGVGRQTAWGKGVIEVDATA